MTYPHAPAPPLSGLADFVTAILERGIVIVLRLEGEPGERRLAVGFGLPDAASPLLLALSASSVLRQHGEEWEDEWADLYE